MNDPLYQVIESSTVSVGIRVVLQDVSVSQVFVSFPGRRLITRSPDRSVIDLLVDGITLPSDAPLVGIGIQEPADTSPARQTPSRTDAPGLERTGNK